MPQHPQSGMTEDFQSGMTQNPQSACIMNKASEIRKYVRHIAKELVKMRVIAGVPDTQSFSGNPTAPTAPHRLYLGITDGMCIARV